MDKNMMDVAQGDVEALRQPFNPDEHEGVGYAEETGLPPGCVAQELRRGYRFCGGLLRPAAVRAGE